MKLNDKTIPITQHRQIVRDLRERRKQPIHIPDWVIRGILAATLAIASGALGWTFSTSQRVTALETYQTSERYQLQEINQRLEDIQNRLMNNASSSDGVYYPPSDWKPYPGLPAATHPIKSEGGSNR